MIRSAIDQLVHTLKIRLVSCGGRASPPIDAQLEPIDLPAVSKVFQFLAEGAWLWKLPRDREAPAASSIKRQPVRTERRVPLDWIPIGGRRSWRICPHMRFRAPRRQ